MKLVHTINLRRGDLVATFVEDGDRWFRSANDEDLTCADQDTLLPAVVIREEDIVQDPGTKREWIARELDVLCPDGLMFTIYGSTSDWAYLIRRRPK